MVLQLVKPKMVVYIYMQSFNQGLVYYTGTKTLQIYFSCVWKTKDFLKGVYLYFKWNNCLCFRRQSSYTPRHKQVNKPIKTEKSEVGHRSDQLAANLDYIHICSQVHYICYYAISEKHPFYLTANYPKHSKLTANKYLRKTSDFLSQPGGISR